MTEKKDFVMHDIDLYIQSAELQQCDMRRLERIMPDALQSPKRGS